MPILIAAFLSFVQADSSAAPSGSQTTSSLVDIFSNIGTAAEAVLVLLAFASLYSWFIILLKVTSFRDATNQSRRFIRAFRKASRLQEISALTADCKASPLAQVFEDVYETYKRQTGGSG